MSIGPSGSDTFRKYPQGEPPSEKNERYFEAFGGLSDDMLMQMAIARRSTSPPYPWESGEVGDFGEDTWFAFLVEKRYQARVATRAVRNAEIINIPTNERLSEQIDPIVNVVSVPTGERLSVEKELLRDGSNVKEHTPGPETGPLAWRSEC